MCGLANSNPIKLRRALAFGFDLAGLERRKGPSLKGPNWIRIGLCGLVAGVVSNLLSAVVLSFAAPDFLASVQRSAPHPPVGGQFFFAVDLAMGIWAVWLYSAIAPRYGTQLTTAAIAGVSWWILKTLQSAKWAGLGFVDLGPALLPLGAATLIVTIVAAMAGAWLYRRVNEPSPRNIRPT